MRSYKTCMHTNLDEIAFLKSTNTLERLRAVMESLTKWVRDEERLKKKRKKEKIDKKKYSQQENTTHL